ncbi:MAG: hypothetical protein ACRD96_00655, partial [Bryobacteraceae bacterium]
MKSILFLVSVSLAFSAPKLRLSAASIGPASIAVSANGAPQTIEAFNLGDGALSLRVASSAAWLVPSVGAARACTTRSGSCLPIVFALQTASLARGMFTGVATVSDPNAVDAPQTITITVQIGGGVPDRIDFFVPPNGSVDSLTIHSNSMLQTRSSQPWLTAILDGQGSFRFALPYLVRAAHLPGMAEGRYDATLTVSGSSFAPDNRSVPVSMSVTSQPIARSGPVQIRLVQNTA